MPFIMVQNDHHLFFNNFFCQISGDPWVSSDPSVPLWDMLPLVTREHLSEEDHAHIIQKMVAGSIATRETIIDCLDRNEYNHVTATYFLLAERKLRAQRHDTARKAKADRERKRGEKPAQHLNISPGKGLPGAALDSLLSPNDLAQVPPQPPPPQPARVPSIKRNFNRMRQISIVEECEEEEEEEGEEEDVEVAATMPARGLSRHSSTSSLADKPSGPSCSSPQLHLDLTLAFAAQRLQAEEDGGAVVATPAPFPQSSQIGTGLSRQNSLRRSGESTSGSSPCSERNETPGSPASPTNSSPARFKSLHSSTSGRKLVSARASPQLGPIVPILNQIHEESEEGGNSPEVDRAKQGSVVGLGAPAGAAVLRRLEQRRRLHKVSVRRIYKSKFWCAGLYFHNYRVFSGYTWNVDLIQQQRIKSYKKPIGV